MSILISLKNIHLEFGQKVIFDQADITIEKGDKIGLIGLNGHGKSTLFKIFTGEVQPQSSRPPFIYDRSQEKFDIFLIPQELNIDDYLDLGIENYYLAFYPELLKIHKELQLDYSNEELFHQFEHLGGWSIQNIYINYLNSFQMTDLNKSLNHLSGGELRKIALSIGLSSPAEFILWDEPTNHLDIETIKAFEDELIQSQKTMMIITHDRYLLNEITTKICHIERGKITQFKGNYGQYLQYLDEKEAERIKNLDKLENKHRRELAWMRQGIKARGTRSKKRVESYEQMKSDIQKLKTMSKKSASFDLAHSGRRSQILVEITDGMIKIGDRELINNVNVLLGRKDKIALIGKNGVGKSTLIKILTGQIQLSSGKFKALENLKIRVFDQNRESLDLEKTPLELIGVDSDFINLPNGKQKHIHSYLEGFLFDSNQIKRPIRTLSGGEKNRLQLALFMKESADLWIFDEPTNDLDIETIEILENELKNYPQSVLIIGHDRAFLDQVCDKTWLIHNQQLEIFDAGYSQVEGYLEALELEEKVREIESKSNIEKDRQKKSDQGPKSTEKKSNKELDKKIEKAEKNLQIILDEMKTFNLDESMGREQWTKYQELESKKITLENEILDLMDQY